MWGSPATCGATGSTSATPRAGRWTSSRTTTAGWSPTSWPNGRSSTVSRSTWCLTGRPAAPSATAVTASTSRSTPSTSSGRSPAAGQAAACSATRCPCNPVLPPHHHLTTRRKIMATVIMQKWDGITPDQYDALRESVGWDRDVPAGMRFHVASFGDGVLRMTDVWDSEELFGAFVQTRILPGLRQLGIPGQPDMITQAAHEITAVDGT